MILALFLIYKNNPSQTLWSPKCIMLATTGYKCPGCGIQRLAYNVLHGNFVTAIKYNYFTAFLFPYFFLWGSINMIPNSKYTININKYFTNKYTAYTYIALYFTWWIVRNIYNI